MLGVRSYLMVIRIRIALVFHGESLVIGFNYGLRLAKREVEI